MEISNAQKPNAEFVDHNSDEVETDSGPLNRISNGKMNVDGH